MIILLLVAYCTADVSTSVYFADGITPVPRRDPNIPDVYVDILVGTHLSIIVSSDDNTLPWNGRLTIKAADITKGQLWPCEFNELTYNELESCSILPAAHSISIQGRPPRVSLADSRTGDYFVGMYGADEPNTGEWFAVDYHAIGLGECRVVFTEFPSQSSPVEVPGGILPADRLVNISVFSHVQTRDFDENYVVDFRDFALMAQCLQNSEGNDPNDFAPEYDFDHNQSIDATDLAMFMGFWLGRTR